MIGQGFPEGEGLDLGCGDGKLMRILLEEAGVSPALIGVDIDPRETRDAAAAGVYREIHAAPGDRVPARDGAFDFVFSNSVLEHIDEIEPVIAEASRVLRSGGRFVFTVPAGDFHDCLAGPLFAWSDRGHYLAGVDRRCAHERYWSAQQWQACLETHGLRTARTVPYLTAPETQRWETLARFTSGVLYGLSGGRLQPIEIQRSLHLRKRSARLPRALAAALAGAISAGIGADEGAAGPYACLYIDARKL